jgi:alkylation response protein AidB-like acyl-CoA dehydrogenase
MLSFSPTEEQEEIRRLAHSIANDELRPRARAAEKDGDMAPDLMQTLAQTGLTTPFSEDYGGSGDIEAITYALIAEELGFGDGGLAMNVIGSMMGPLTVALAGNERQQGEYIVPFCGHEGYKERGSLAFAERSGGYSLTDISTTLRRAGQDYSIKGTKRDVIHGAQSRPRIVLLRLEGTAGNAGLCAALLDDETLAGVRIRPETQKLGLQAAPSASYNFESAVIPASALLGEPGNSGVLRAATLYLILRAGVACGMARAALEYASKYAQERIAFGRPIVSYQGIAFMISEMAMKLDAARLLLWNAATNWDRGAADEALIHDAEASHYQAVKIAKSGTTDAVQILGGAGFMQDHPVEMWMRDAAAME